MGKRRRRRELVQFKGKIHTQSWESRRTRSAEEAVGIC